jgi:hypothetical protein
MRRLAHSSKHANSREAVHRLISHDLRPWYTPGAHSKTRLNHSENSARTGLPRHGENQDRCAWFLARTASVLCRGTVNSFMLETRAPVQHPVSSCPRRPSTVPEKALAEEYVRRDRGAVLALARSLPRNLDVLVIAANPSMIHLTSAASDARSFCCLRKKTSSFQKACLTKRLISSASLTERLFASPRFCRVSRIFCKQMVNFKSIS